MARINLNPILVGMVKSAHWQHAKLLLRSTRYYASGAALAGAICVVMFFMFTIHYIAPEKGLQQGLSSLIILLVGLTVVSAYIPFENLLMVSGFPFYQTIQNLSVVLTNSVLNIALVPLIGIDGAALGTAVSYCAGIAVLVVLARRLLGWNLLTNAVTER
jgi:O-antigen/teichoic acid export membrane protein